MKILLLQVLIATAALVARCAESGLQLCGPACEAVRRRAEPRVLLQSDEEEDLKPRMTDDERAFLLQYQSDVQGVYFEYGCGGSTFQASLMPNITLALSVEGDAGWIDRLKGYKPINDAMQAGRLAFFHIHYNANPKDWSRPKDESMKENWPSYSRAILTATAGPLAMVFIDGRFRVACALNALSRVDENTVVLFHDYHREQYAVVEQFYDKVFQVDTLVRLRKKTNIDEYEVQKLLQHYETTYD